MKRSVIIIIVCLMGVLGLAQKQVKITDPRAKVVAAASHVLEIKPVFTGCHSKMALEYYVSLHPSYKYELLERSGRLDGVYSANPILIDTVCHDTIRKGNNGGVSTFFPDSWNSKQIIDRVSSVAASNLKRVRGNEYFGSYTDSGDTVKIHFYINKKNNSIISFFPVW